MYHARIDTSTETGRRSSGAAPAVVAPAAAVSPAASGAGPTGAMPPAPAASALDGDTSRIRYKTVQVDGIEIFYREAGDATSPTILLLHGFPSSSHMFRKLIPLLSARFHVVAPDYPGFGFSDAPGAERFHPTFANLATVMGDFVRALRLGPSTFYLHDFGAPVGFRLAAEHPDWVNGLVIQNANAYVEGIAPDVLNDMKTRAAGPLDATASEGLDRMLSIEGTRFQYVTGTRDPANIDPTSYRVDAWIQALPEQRRIQRALIVDYYDNVLQYPVWHRYLRDHQPKTLIVWGRNDPIFVAAGAEAYRPDLPDAELDFYETGHFALEEDAAAIALRIDRWCAREPTRSA